MIAPSTATMRRMTDEEIADFVSTRGFGVLSLADHNHAYGVPLFYGAHGDAIYFQTRAGAKTHYLYATTQACLTISSTRAMGEWASAQVVGRLDRIDGDAEGALVDVPPPLIWDTDDDRDGGEMPGAVTTFRLAASSRAGRYSRPAPADAMAAGY